MAVRKTDPEPFPIRGTPTGYRDRWEADDRALLQAQLAEHKRLLAAVRECAGPQGRGGRRRVSSEPPQPAAPADSSMTEP